MTRSGFIYERGMVKPRNSTTCHVVSRRLRKCSQLGVWDAETRPTFRPDEKMGLEPDSKWQNLNMESRPTYENRVPPPYSLE